MTYNYQSSNTHSSGYGRRPESDDLPAEVLEQIMQWAERRMEELLRQGCSFDEAKAKTIDGAQERRRAEIHARREGRSTFPQNEGAQNTNHGPPPSGSHGQRGAPQQDGMPGMENHANYNGPGQYHIPTADMLRYYQTFAQLIANGMPREEAMRQMNATILRDLRENGQVPPDDRPQGAGFGSAQQDDSQAPPEAGHSSYGASSSSYRPRSRPFQPPPRSYTSAYESSSGRHRPTTPPYSSSHSTRDRYRSPSPPPRRYQDHTSRDHSYSSRSRSNYDDYRPSHSSRYDSNPFSSSSSSSRRYDYDLYTTSFRQPSYSSNDYRADAEYFRMRERESPERHRSSDYGNRYGRGAGGWDSDLERDRYDRY